MNSPISRIGGKLLLRKDILSRFPHEPFDRYVEPFGGAGWILFASNCHAPLEVFNDFDGELINLYRCMKYHRRALQEEIRWILNSRELFEDAKAQQDCRGFTDIQRAAQYYLLIKLSYGSDVRTYGGAKKNLTKAREYLTAVQQRLDSVRIEHKDFGAIIRQYDSPCTLFYLDPPYLGTENYYSGGFGAEDHDRLRDMLGSIKGRFILSYNDHPEIRRRYECFRIDPVIRSSNMTGRYQDAEHRYQELLIMNYEGESFPAAFCGDK